MFDFFPRGILHSKLYDTHAILLWISADNKLDANIAGKLRVKLSVVLYICTYEYCEYFEWSLAYYVIDTNIETNSNLVVHNWPIIHLKKGVSMYHLETYVLEHITLRKQYSFFRKKNSFFLFLLIIFEAHLKQQKFWWWEVNKLFNNYILTVKLRMIFFLFVYLKREN